MSEQYDLIVVGGGLGGSSLAASNREARSASPAA